MRKLLALLGLAGLLVMACGGGGGGASSPEDAVSAFFDAVKSGDADTAGNYIVGGIPEEEQAEFEQMGSVFDSMDFEVTGSEIEGDEAVVFVSISFMGQSETDEIDCVMDGGVWKLTGTGF